MEKEKTKIVLKTVFWIFFAALTFMILWFNMPRFSVYARFYSFWNPGWVEVKLTDGSFVYGRLVGLQAGFLHLLDVREPEVFTKQDTNEQRFWLTPKQAEIFLGSSKVVSWNFVSENSEIFSNLSR